MAVRTVAVGGGGCSGIKRAPEISAISVSGWWAPGRDSLRRQLSIVRDCTKVSNLQKPCLHRYRHHRQHTLALTVSASSTVRHSPPYKTPELGHSRLPNSSFRLSSPVRELRAESRRTTSFDHGSPRRSSFFTNRQHLQLQAFTPSLTTISRITSGKLLNGCPSVMI